MGGGRAEFSVATLSERSELLGRGGFNLQARRTSSWDANTKKMTGPTVGQRSVEGYHQEGWGFEHLQAATRMSRMTRAQSMIPIIEML